MDSFEITKFAGAALSALLVAFGGTTFVEIAGGGHGGDHAVAGYQLPIEGASASAGAHGGAKEEATFSAADVAAKVAEASAEKGQAAFKKCATCHTPNEGGKNGTGPNLFGIVGRNKGGQDGFKFSAALAGKAGEPWTVESLAEFLHSPKAAVPGTKMAFAGVKNEAELANILAYLGSLKK